MKETIHYIYKLVNTINQKCYIGYSVNPIRRFKSHIRIAATNKGYALHNAIRKYGSDNFIMDILYCSKEYEHTITEIEPYFIKLFDSRTNGYNLTNGGESNYGWNPSIETRQKMSKIHKGKRLSISHKSQISKFMKLNPPMHNKQIRDKVSNTLKTRNIRPVLTPEQKELKRLKQIGKPIHSAEWKLQLSERFKTNQPMHDPIIKAKAIENKKGKGVGAKNGRAVFVKIFKEDILICEGHLQTLCNKYEYPFKKFLSNSRSLNPLERGIWKGWNIIRIAKSEVNS